MKNNHKAQRHAGNIIKSLAETSSPKENVGESAQLHDNAATATTVF